MGELFAFVGPNGADKTTTVEIIDTIRTPTSGTVRLLGMDVTKRKRDILPRIGVLPQGFTSFDRITVTETIQYYSRLFYRRNTDPRGADRAREPRKQEQRTVPKPLWRPEAAARNSGRARERPRGRFPKGQPIAMGSPEELIRGHAKCLVFTLKSADERALEIVRTMGFEPVQDDHRNITVNVEHPTDVWKILNALTDAEASFLTLDVRKPSLEAIFLELTGEALRQGSAETMRE